MTPGKITLKKNLRKRYLALRRALTGPEAGKLSSGITSAIAETAEFKKAKTVMLYYPVGNEADVTGLMTFRKRFLFPVVSGEKLIPAVYGKKDGFVRGKFGIPVPSGNRGYKGSIDLVIVPGAVFDMTGARLGMGKGYYDRFLKSKKTFKIGAAYQFQVIKKVPCDENDIGMDLVITENKIYSSADIL